MIQIQNSQHSDYERLGGAQQLRLLVDRFYDLMHELPETRAVRELHPEDLTGSRQKLFEFLSGWLGGPPLFVEKHGPPMLRRRHLPFRIGAQESDQWLLCMRTALDEFVTDEELRTRLFANLSKVAEHMRNA